MTVKTADGRVIAVKSKPTSERLKSLAWHASLLVVLVVVLYPAAWVLFASFKDNVNIVTDSSLLPSDITFEHYLSAFDGLAGVPLWRFFWNSTVIATLSVVGIVLSCSITAYALGRLNFPGRKVMFAVVIATLLLPGQVMLIPQYLIFSELGWVNSIVPLVIAKFLGLDAFFVFLYVQFMRGIPRELDQAAKIDGAGHFRIFFSIMLPLLRPAIVTSSIFTFIWSWNDFMGPLIYLHQIDKFPLPRLLQSYENAEALSNYGGMMAMNVLSLIPVVLFFLVFQRFLIRGIATSGVKG
jgi:multiple sugar transport system permease protein